MNKDKLAARKKRYYLKNREKVRAKNKAYYAENRERLILAQRQYNADNREAIRSRAKKRYVDNRSKFLATNKQWRENNREKFLESSRKCHAKNRYKANARSRSYYFRNRERLRALGRKYYADNKIKVNASTRVRWASSPNFRLANCLRRRLNIAIRRHPKSASALSLLGCSVEDLWLYLESKFEPGMTRQNYGKVWHIDHIMPCAIFDLSKPEHQRRCFHFSNLQPLFAADNHRKGPRITQLESQKIK